MCKILCSQIFSIASGGRSSITDPFQAKTHNKALLAKSQSGCVPNYFCKRTPSKTNPEVLKKIHSSDEYYAIARTFTQNNQGTVKIIDLHIILLRLQFQCVGQFTTFMYHILALSYITFHRPNLLILPNNTKKKHDYGVYCMHFKWQLPSSTPTRDFKWTSLKMPRKNGHFILRPRHSQFSCN